MSSGFFTLEELGLSNETTLSSSIDENVDSNPGAVLEINDLDTLSEIRPLWNELLQVTPQPTFNQSFEWLQLYGQHFIQSSRACGEARRGTASQRLRALIVDENGETSGLVVLVEERRRGGWDLMLPRVGSELLGPLGRNPSRTWQTVIAHLSPELSWDKSLDLRGLADPQCSLGLSLGSTGLKLCKQSWSSASTVRARASLEAYWSSLSPRLQRIITTSEQRLAALGPISFERFRPQLSERIDPRVPSGLYERCLAIALNDERQLHSSDSLLNDPARHDFLRDLFPTAWQSAAADLCLLSIGSQAVAFRFHTRMLGQLQTVWTGTDANFRDLPLSSLLLHQTLRDGITRGDLNVQLGETSEEVAREWSAESTPLFRFTIGTTASPLPSKTEIAIKKVKSLA